MNNKKFIITIIILAVIVAAVSFFAVNEARKNKEMSQLFAVEKQEMENEYSTFATQYDELQIQINNDSLREKLESEKLKTQRLLEELRQVKTSDATEIMRLKKRIENRTGRIAKLCNANRLSEQNQCCLNAGKSGSKK